MELTGAQYEQAKAQGKDVQHSIEGFQTDAERKIDEARREAAKKLTKAVDIVDGKTDEAAAKTKGGIWNWFGGKQAIVSKGSGDIALY